MIAFPSMLIKAAKAAGIKTPPNETKEEQDAIDSMTFEKEKFPYFTVYCIMQIGRRCNPMGCHWDNAKVIASIPEEKILTVTGAYILEMGFI